MYGRLLGHEFRLLIAQVREQLPADRVEKYSCKDLAWHRKEGNHPVVVTFMGFALSLPDWNENALPVFVVICDPSSRVDESQLTEGSASRTAPTSPGKSRPGRNPHDTTPQICQPIGPRSPILPPVSCHQPLSL